MTNLALGIVFQTRPVFSEKAFPFAFEDLFQTFWLLFPQGESCEKHWFYRTSFPSTVNVNRQKRCNLLAERKTCVFIYTYCSLRSAFWFDELVSIPTCTGYCLKTMTSTQLVNPPSPNKDSSGNGNARAWLWKPSFTSHRARRVELACSRSINDDGAFRKTEARVNFSEYW